MSEEKEWFERDWYEWPWKIFLGDSSKEKKEKLEQLRWTLPHLLGKQVMIETEDSTKSNGIVKAISYRSVTLGSNLDHNTLVRTNIKIESIRALNCEFFGIRKE